jgi:sec-independent protein translocase protein TatC
MFSSEQIIGLLEWLARVRRKLLLLILLPAVAAAFFYFQAERLTALALVPLKGLELYFLTPVEALSARLKLAFFCGLLTALPMMAYLLFSVWARDIPRHTWRLLAFAVIPLALLFFYGGLVFGYLIILPAAVNFLIQSGREFMTPLISAGSYFSFLIFMTAGIGLIFELPLVLVLLGSFGIVSYKMLSRQRRMAIMLILIILAILTPTPDAFTLLLVSAPMVLLYEVSIWGVWLLERGRKKVKL